MVITQPYNSRPRRLTHFGVESLGVERDRLWTEGDDFKKRLRRKQIILVSALNSAFGLCSFFGDTVSDADDDASW